MRTFLSVVLGFIVWSVLWVGGNQIFMAAMPDRFAPDGAVTDVPLLCIFLVLSIVYSFFSGWLTAKVARSATNQPALILGALLLVVGIAVQAGFWDSMPIWYHLLFLAGLLPATVLGGRTGSGADQ